MSKKKKGINKIIYFDKETISNILQERNKGELSRFTDTAYSTTTSGSVSATVNSKIDLQVPFLTRFLFMITGKIDASFIIMHNSLTTVSSTEVSEFEKIKEELVCLNKVQLYDIENSSTSFRVAGSYMRMLKAGVEDVDTNEFISVMDNYDGYDTYKVDENRYVRFNNTAFISNYKRNDLLTTTMDIYCIPVGTFRKERFDFMLEINKMDQLIKDSEKPQTLNSIYPPKENNGFLTNRETSKEPESGKDVILYDALYACIASEDTDE